MPRSIGKNNYDKPRELEKNSHTYRLIGWFLKLLNGRDQQLQQSTSKQDQCQPPIYKLWFISQGVFSQSKYFQSAAHMPPPDQIAQNVINPRMTLSRSIHISYIYIFICSYSNNKPNTKSILFYLSIMWLGNSQSLLSSPFCLEHMDTPTAPNCSLLSGSIIGLDVRWCPQVM